MDINTAIADIKEVLRTNQGNWISIRPVYLKMLIEHIEKEASGLGTQCDCSSPIVAFLSGKCRKCKVS